MSDQEQMNAGWKAHRKDAFRITAAGGGILVVDATRTPPRAWVARVEAGTLRVRTAGMPVQALVDQSPEIVFNQIWSGNGAASRDLPPFEAAALMGVMPGRESWAQLSVRRFSESVDDLLRARLPLDRILASEETRLNGAGLSHLREELDMEALMLLQGCENFGWKDYGYYAIRGAPGTLDEARRTVRHQAAKAYPMMAVFIANRFGVKADLDKQAKFMIARAPIKASLDAAKAAGDAEAEAAAKAEMDALPKPSPLLDSLERSLTPSPTRELPAPKSIVSRSALGRIGGVTLGPRGMMPEYVAMRMSELPPDWFPKKGADWKEADWVAFTDLIATVGPMLGRITKSPPEMLYEGCMGRWADLRDRMVRAFTDSRPPAGMLAEETAALEAAIDWKSLKALPRVKVDAAAAEMASRMHPILPEGVDVDSVSDWIVRLVAPPLDREVIQHACNEVEIASNMLATRVMLPLAAHLTGDADPMLNSEQFEAASTLASSVLFGGKSAVKVFEVLSEFHKNGAAIQSGGTFLPHEIEDEKAKQDVLLREQMLMEKKKKVGVAASVGIDPDETHDFPIPFDPVIVAPNGVHLCTLFNWRHFQDEGRGFRGDQFGTQEDRRPGTAYGFREDERNPDGSYSLNICVGMYKFSYNACHRGEFSISARVPGDLVGDGAPFTRLTLNSLYGFKKDKEGQWIVSEKEHKASMNKKPCDLSLEAFQWFFEGIKNGTIAHTLENVQEHVAVKATKLDRIEDICGYNWTEMPRIGAAIRPWSKVLPKRARGNTAAFSRLPEVQALAGSLSPGWIHRASLRGAAWGHESYAPVSVEADADTDTVAEIGAESGMEAMAPSP